MTFNIFGFLFLPPIISPALREFSLFYLTAQNAHFRRLSRLHETIPGER
ncbi:MAG: hypothetical protein ACRC10_11670 [Thermoguttaceae bacterium]